MTDAKPIATPLSATVGLQQTDGSVSADGTSYRQIFGALQYLTLTRPDICFAVNKLSQFMQSPSQLHWQAAKRILRYLKATIFHGLFLRQSSSSTLAAYSDSDWGAILMIAALHVLTLSSLVAISFPGPRRSKSLWHVPLLKPSFVPLLLPFLSFVGFDTDSQNLVFGLLCPSCSVTILVPLMFAQILDISLV